MLIIWDCLLKAKASGKPHNILNLFKVKCPTHL